MNTTKLSNPYSVGLRACSILANAMQLIKEHTPGSEAALLANQARALVWVAGELFNPEPHPVVRQSSLMFEMSGSMEGRELTQDDRVRLASSLLEQAESLVAECKPRSDKYEVNVQRMFQTPEDTGKAVRFAQQLIDKSYTGTRYMFQFTNGK